MGSNPTSSTRYSVKCEQCNSKHHGDYASGRFCSEQCYRQFCSNRANQRKQLKAAIIKEHYEKNPRKCPECESALPYEKRRAKFCGHSCAGKYANKGKFWSKKKCRRCDKVPECGVLCNSCRENLQDPHAALIDNGSRKPPRWALLKIREYRCEGKGCSVVSDWLGSKIVLHLDHINGKKTDHRPENIRWLCPNCHSQTPTFAGRNIKNPLRVSSTVERNTLNVGAEGSNPSP